jgi:hypothetical protein
MEVMYVLADTFGFPRCVNTEEYLMVLHFDDEQDAVQFRDESGLDGYRVVPVAMDELVRKIAPSTASIDAANSLLAQVAADGDGGDDEGADASQ